MTTPALRAVLLGHEKVAKRLISNRPIFELMRLTPERREKLEWIDGDIFDSLYSCLNELDQLELRAILGVFGYWDPWRDVSRNKPGTNLKGDWIRRVLKMITPGVYIRDAAYAGLEMGPFDPDAPATDAALTLSHSQPCVHKVPMHECPTGSCTCTAAHSDGIAEEPREESDGTGVRGNAAGSICTTQLETSEQALEANEEVNDEARDANMWVCVLDHPADSPPLVHTGVELCPGSRPAWRAHGRAP
jgi:hypothetical protein